MRSIDEIKHDYAIKEGYNSFDEMMMNNPKYSDIIEIIDELMCEAQNELKNHLKSQNNEQ